MPVDLNSLLFGLEGAIGEGCERAHDEPCARNSPAVPSGVARRWIATYGTRPPGPTSTSAARGARIPRLSAATLYPLFTGMSSEKQAIAVGATVRKVLLKPGGIVTTPLETGQQWDAPNGWAPLQWIGVAGLARYGSKGLAEVIACRWMLNVNDVYAQRGKLVEKYDVWTPGRAGGGGEYPLQDGFGWTNGVMRKLMALYPANANVRSAAQCPKIEDVTP